MSALAPTLQAFFTERLIAQRQASPHTIAAYRDTFRLLLVYARERTGIAPHELDFEDLDAALIGAFLDHLERDRGNSARTRNHRLAAIHSLYHYAALRHPEHAATIARVLAIPAKRHDRAIVSYLTEPEAAALLAAPDRSSWIGRRDHALMTLAIQTGLRVSEITALHCRDVNLTAAPHVQTLGKGRKERITPMTKQTVNILRAWMRERAGDPEDPLFPTSRGRPLSRDAVALRVAKHTAAASLNCPTVATKTVTPHVLRHTTGMNLLHAGVDTSVIALWFGHESTEATQIYLHADMAIKERALARVTPIGVKPGRYRPTRPGSEPRPPDAATPPRGVAPPSPTAPGRSRARAFMVRPRWLRRRWRGRGSAELQRLRADLAENVERCSASSARPLPTRRNCGSSPPHAFESGPAESRKTRDDKSSVCR